ncbi:hypothetical protein KAU11_10335 [Candidatus Babeliales bacterium]|nr:hypothetical protein [Candidatus Babeliales bacterium]
MIKIMSKTPIHIMPVNDIRPHTEKMTCNCKPKVESRNKTMLVIHNAYDGREIRE